MQKSGGAAILMKRNDIEYLFGTSEIKTVARTPYQDECILFLDAWSKEIRNDIEARTYPDIQTFAFWIRKANMMQLKKSFEEKEDVVHYKRIGKGLVFHIAPSNVPINFAYTFVFGLLSGNSNIVKVSSKRFRQVEILCRILEKVVESEEYQWAKEQNAVVLYERSASGYTDEFSAKCDMRIIWGGDRTIREIRKSPIGPRITELTFADRYSFAVLSAESVISASEEEIRKLAKDFYNDTYLMDQNACSSPHLVCWYGKEAECEQAGGIFWNAVYNEALGYDLADVKVSEKYTMLCEMPENIELKSVKRFDNILYVVGLRKIPETMTALRGKFGLFFEYILSDVEDICVYVDKKVQTCAVYGVNKEDIVNCIIRHNIQGIDRIVPLGKTLDISMIWDGYDIVGELSRCILF